MFFFVFRGATASRVLRKVKLRFSVRWLTDLYSSLRRPCVGGGSLEGHLGIFGLSGNLKHSFC
jgi:hypothetical protein